VNIEKVILLPYYRDGDEIKMLFMKPSNPKYGGYSFQCCKGCIDEGYSSEQAVLKEAEEELGLTSDNIKNFDFLFYDYLNYNDGSCSVVYVYTAEVIYPNNLIPFHYETGDIKWMNIKEVSEQLRFMQRSIVYRVYNRIK